MSSIPLVDLKAQHRQVNSEVLEGFSRVLENTSFVLGPEVAAFEAEFAAFSQVPHCVGVANGTDALELALRALGIGIGDEVVLPANTFIATPLAVVRAGATPVLVDCDPLNYLIDVDQVERAITPRTRAIIPVHLFGQMAPMQQLQSLIGSRKIELVEDAAQSQGARQGGKVAGGLGAIAATSFYPGKNLGAYGDGGGVLTTSERLAKKVRALRNYGSEVKYHHPEIGFNSRLDALQAVVLSAKLKRLAGWNAQRRAAADRYNDLLRGLSQVTLPQTAPGNEHIWHLFVVRVPNRDSVLAKLNAAGVGAAIHYPLPVHLQGAFAHLGHRPGSFPVAEKAAAEMLSLPMFAEITPAQQQRVADELASALA